MFRHCVHVLWGATCRTGVQGLREKISYGEITAAHAAHLTRMNIGFSSWTTLGWAGTRKTTCTHLQAAGGALRSVHQRADCLAHSVCSAIKAAARKQTVAALHQGAHCLLHQQAPLMVVHSTAASIGTPARSAPCMRKIPTLRQKPVLCRTADSSRRHNAGSCRRVRILHAWS